MTYLRCLSTDIIWHFPTRCDFSLKKSLAQLISKYDNKVIWFFYCERSQLTVTSSSWIELLVILSRVYYSNCLSQLNGLLGTFFTVIEVFSSLFHLLKKFLFQCNCRLNTRQISRICEYIPCYNDRGLTLRCDCDLPVWLMVTQWESTTCFDDNVIRLETFAQIVGTTKTRWRHVALMTRGADSTGRSLLPTTAHTRRSRWLTVRHLIDTVLASRLQVRAA